MDPSSRTRISEIQLNRSIHGINNLPEIISKALHDLTIPDGWCKIVSKASITYRPMKHPLPSVKVHLTNRRIDVDQKVCGKVVSTVYSPPGLPALVAQAKRVLEQFL